MNRSFISGALPLLLALTPALGMAQPAPAVAGAGDVAQAWRAPLEGYRPFSDEKTADWPQANETVLRAGGWRAYAREAAQPPSGASPAASPPLPAADAAEPHAGHHKP